MTTNYLHSDITSIIIKAFYNVYNALGYGFLEKVYENSMIIELNKLGLNCRKQVPLKVYYDDVKVGDYFADIIVEDKVIIELKSIESLNDVHLAQVITYLKLSGCKLGLLMNFNVKSLKLGIKRVVNGL